MPPKTNTVDPLAAAMQRLAALEAENAALKAAKQGKLSLKVSELGALSIYGLARFPVTLYVSQLDTLFGESMQASIKAFVAAHKADFATGKDDPRFVAVRAARKAAKDAGAL